MNKGKYAYTFEILAGYNGLKGLQEKSFTTTDFVFADTEQEARCKLDEQNDELGYKILNVSLLKIETQKEFSERATKEFDETFDEANNG